jgi:hypothetical protein
MSTTHSQGGFSFRFTTEDGALAERILRAPDLDAARPTRTGTPTRTYLDTLLGGGVDRLRDLDGPRAQRR